MGKSEIGLEGMSLDQLQGLQGAISILIKKKTNESNRQAGRTFARLRDIPASGEHVHRFKFAGRINAEHPSSAEMRKFFGLKGVGPSNYECDCEATAYSCDNCGYIPGKPRSQPFDNRSPGDGRGTAGIEQVCTVCDALLGQTTTLYSD